MDHSTVVFVHMVADVILGLAYIAIAIVLVALVRRVRAIPFSGAFVAFAVFIVTCGLVHLGEAATHWSPLSWSVAVLKLFCAVASVGTAVAMVPLLPRAVSLATTRALLQTELASRERSIEALTHELIARRRDAERANRAKGDFLALITHEVRTPVTSIQLQLERLRRGRNAAEVVPEMSMATRRLVDIVETLITYADLRAARAVARRDHVDLDAACVSLIEERQGEASRRSVELRFASRAQVAQTSTDRALVELAIGHLLDNAIDHSGGGVVELFVEVRDHRIAVIVRDTGPGIPEAIRDAMFEPFVHGESIRTKHAAGLGLGLTIVREAVEILGGALEIETSATGTEVAIVLPRELEPSQATSIGVGPRNAVTAFLRPSSIR